MPMTSEEKLAYSRGYYSGAKNNWPNHKPPHPPVEVIAQLMEAAQNLRDKVDGFVSTHGAGDDECREYEEEKFGDGIDLVDEAMGAISIWLKEEMK